MGENNIYKRSEFFAELVLISVFQFCARRCVQLQFSERAERFWRVSDAVNLRKKIIAAVFALACFFGSTLKADSRTRTTP